MKNSLQKLKPSAPGQAPADIDAISARVVDLRALDRQLSAEFAELTSSGPVDDAGTSGPADISLLVKNFVSGDLDRIPSPGPPLPARIDQIRNQRAAIELALKDLDVRALTAWNQRASAELERRGREWRNLLRETAIAICKLQALNRTRERVAKEIRGKSLIVPPGSQFSAGRIFGLGYSNEGGHHEFLTLALRLRVITPGEIAQERGDTPERFNP